jgi:hypothetical protein
MRYWSAAVVVAVRERNGLPHENRTKDASENEIT